MIEKYYEDLSNDKYLNAEPLFWLQYAILRKAHGDLVNACLFLNAGYARASNKPNFKTYQLDTQHLSILLMQEGANKSIIIENFEDIFNSMTRIGEMISEESHRYYAIEVIGEIPSFIDAKVELFSNSEKSGLITQLSRISNALNDLSAEVKMYSGSEGVRKNIERAISKMYF